MKKLNILQRLCKSVGENNNAAYAVVAVAVAKGIFRPMFTMMDKHEEYETKKYTALREGLTEVIAIPCYIFVPTLASKIIAPIIGKGNNTPQTKAAAKTLSFIGVCAAALVIIPATCSAVINPIMDFMQKHKKSQNKCEVCGNTTSDVGKTLDISEQNTSNNAPVFMSIVNQQPSLKKTYNSFNTMAYNSGLTIGGGK